MGTPTTPSSDVCVTATGLSRLRKAATRRAVPALLLPSVPPGGLPPTAPTREPRSPRAAAWPLTVARDRLRMPRMRDPLPHRTMVPRLLTTVSAPWTRRKLPLLR